MPTQQWSDCATSRVSTRSARASSSITEHCLPYGNIPILAAIRLFPHLSRGRVLQKSFLAQLKITKASGLFPFLLDFHFLQGMVLFHHIKIWVVGKTGLWTPCGNRSTAVKRNGQTNRPSGPAASLVVFRSSPACTLCKRTTPRPFNT